MPLTLSDYIKQLQQLEAEGHGALLLCTCTEDGWEAMSSRDLPYVTEGQYSDETCTRWSYKVGPYIVA